MINYVYCFDCKNIFPLHLAHVHYINVPFYHSVLVNILLFMHKCITFSGQLYDFIKL